jgi:hypothetical protein
MNSMNFIITLCFLFVWALEGFSQKDQKMQLDIKRQEQPIELQDKFLHFELYPGDSESFEQMEQALHSFNRLESYRMVEQRRKIPFSDGKSFVVLYSANELKESSGRSIRPQNIRSGDKYPQIVFHLTQQGTIKEEVVD